MKVEDRHTPPPEIVMSGFCSKSSRYHLAVAGEFGAREIKNIIAFLQLQLEWASEDEATTETEGEAHDKG